MPLKLLGVAFSNVNRWEFGLYAPTIKAKRKLAPVFEKYNIVLEEIKMFTFEKTKEMCVDLYETQYKQLSNKKDIKSTLMANKAIGFNIKLNDEIIGFAMLRKYEDGCFFLWDYAIDCKYQNKKYGTNALKELVMYFKEHYNAKEISTTYIFGNEIAAHVYEKVGFVETDVVDEDDIHEVNMLLTINKLRR